MTRASQAAVRQAAAPAWPWSLEAGGYDRSAALTTAEQNALDALGWELRRWPDRWHDPGQGEWPVLHRLILPLATARDHLEVLEDNDFQRRSAADAVALVLRGCATHRASFWAWDAAAWAEILGPSRNAFQDLYPGWADSSARTYAIGLACLFGFTELNRAQLLEAKDNLQRMLAAVPLTDDERAAVDDGQAALGKLLGQFADTPTPAGPTPRQLGHLPLLQILPGPPA